MGHTQDDQAETVMMRLQRGSGVDGLAGMRSRRNVHGWEVLRPLLNVTRAQLRHYAKTLHVPYVDDPSNNDPTYARVRARKFIAALEVDQHTLTATATRMSRASEALRRRAYDVASQIIRDDPRLVGSVAVDRDQFAAIEIDTQLRILAAALQYVASQPYRPRADPLEAALDMVLSGGTATLAGGVAIAHGDRIVITREPNAVAETTTPVDGASRWDQRWLISGAEITGCEVRALGEAGLKSVPYDTRKGVPRLALASLPAIWNADTLIACRPCGIGPLYVDELCPIAGNFPRSLLMH
jgi:tRNA(Ile)-lysidine synthase